MHQYRFRKINKILFRGKKSTANLEIELFEKALNIFDETLAKLDEVSDILFSTLGMRNLSAFIGELFAFALAKSSNGFLVKNPHQDGYPDLLVMTEEGKALLKSLDLMMQDKEPFSDFESGGIEVKATCGSVPTPAQLRKKNLKKPEIGDQRIGVMKGYDWKAHHRLTNNLVGIVWDFINGTPTIVAIFFASNLTEDDWGVIVQPFEGGGRTTSVSIMPRKGVYKMYEGWIAIIDDERYVEFFSKFNGTGLID